jgi:hypothetical protein
MREWDALRRVRRGIAAGVLATLLLPHPATAQDQTVLAEVLSSWQGNDAIQFVELELLADGQQGTANAAELVFDDATGADGTRRFFTLTANLVRGTRGAKVLLATPALAALAGVTPDFTLPAGSLAVRAGRVCWQVRDPGGGARVVDCVAYGAFTGPRLGLGPPTPVTPDNRSLERIALSGSNRDDWRGQLAPTPTNNAGATAMLATLCGDGQLSQGEECDGASLGGQTCASLGFSSGRLACAQCHFDTSRCSFCGNGALNGKEQCDGNELGGKTCEALGYTGGTLGCTDRCKLTVADCASPFFVAGMGGARRECVLEWRVESAIGGPGTDGVAAAKLRCRDGDPSCDADATAGTCTFRVAPCLGRSDARLPACTARGTAEWALLAPDAADPGAAALIASVSALGSSMVSGGTVVFAPPLDATARCAATVGVVVPVRGRVKLRAKATPPEGRPRDVDPLTLVCVP